MLFNIFKKLASVEFKRLDYFQPVWLLLIFFGMVSVSTRRVWSI